MRFLLVSLAATTLVANFAISAPLASKEIDFFEKNIRPALAKHCYECHSATSKRIKGGLRLDTRHAILRGGDSGSAINHEAPESSLILRALRYEENLEMPPDGQLPSHIVQAFEKWVSMGAPDPREETTLEPDIPADSVDELWSLQPIAAPELPQLANDEPIQNPIDAFVLEQLESRNIPPNGPATEHALFRRLSFDLIGLPPTPGEIDSFIQEAQRDRRSAVERSVDSLLASPHFGERWGRHWLDVARYADSNGQSRDVLFPHAWRYRNWVIDAFNEDLPYDDFIRQQIAGDLMTATSNEESVQQQIATGFLAIGSKPLVAGNLTLDLIDDQIDAVSRSFMGLTVSCARCHDHKFDPIPTADYYALGGIFASTKTFYGGGPKRPKTMSEAAKLWLPITNGRPSAIQRLAELEKRIQKLTKDENSKQKRLKRLQKNSAKNTDAIRTLQQSIKELKRERDPLTKERDQLPIEFAMGVRDSGKTSDLEIRIRGEKSKRGPRIPRGFLSCIDIDDSPEIAKSESGRLALANWITHPSNPLTARVAANRIWSHLFGRGLVETVDNFGHSGARPSHPALLDYLASSLRSHWSVKTLIKQIVTSDVYQRSSQFSAHAHEKDPENQTLWRFQKRRLEIEPLRDALLAMGNRLNKDPHPNSVVAEIGEGEVGRGINTKPLSAPFHHRAVYLPVLRTAMLGMQKTFDYPDPSSIQGRRDSTNVPAQSLFMLNSPLVVQSATSMAKRIQSSNGSLDQGIAEAYLLAYSRPPSKEEIGDAARFLRSNQATDKNTLPWKRFCHALIAAAEFRYVL